MFEEMDIAVIMVCTYVSVRGSRFGREVRMKGWQEVRSSVSRLLRFKR